MGAKGASHTSVFEPDGVGDHRDLVIVLCRGDPNVHCGIFVEDRGDVGDAEGIADRRFGCSGPIEVAHAGVERDKACAERVSMVQASSTGTRSRRNWTR
ncbi:MAG: hypothetical protein ACJAXA_002951 [Candidatus Aldehydirespiratoraceae bacterium]|jgi:hypothetical protein